MPDDEMNFAHDPEVGQALPSYAKDIDEGGTLVAWGEYCCKKNQLRGMEGS
ncbi:hypothetical protein [Sedimenticola selenatireducens]|uniref:hypothetical protein n=1 Tax=Sedimenticola selenatireducens TaxID=191960 RepID=UPI002354290D|nr:hypothetical protein [Sedimenticola selenatireducens]